jgi:hypothetical protein
LRITRVAEEFVKVADASKVPEGSMKMVKIGDTEVFSNVEAIITQ